MLLAIATSLPILACVGGPDSCFLPPSIVDGPRILAVRADPPDQLVDLTGPTPPTIRARVLRAGPASSEPLRLGGSLCVPTADLRCPEGSFTVPTGPGSVSFEAETTFAVPLALISAAREADPLRGYGGIRVQYDAVATSGPSESHAAKMLVFQTDPDVTPNGALELTSIDVTNESDPINATLESTGEDPVVTQVGTPGTALSCAVRHTYDLRPRVVAGAGATEPAEQYTTVDLDGRTVTLRESISYSFFTTHQIIFGDLKMIAGNPRAIYVPGADVADEPPVGLPDPPRGLARMTVLEAGPMCLPKVCMDPYHTPILRSLWVVARDGRGAVAWTYATVTIEDRRICSDASTCADLAITCDA